MKVKVGIDPDARLKTRPTLHRTLKKEERRYGAFGISCLLSGRVLRKMTAGAVLCRPNGISRRLVAGRTGNRFSGTMEKEGKLECLRCGRCCLADFAAYVTDEDLRRWEKEKRQDILDMLAREHASWEGDHLVSADSGRTLHGCPFFFFDGTRFGCAIHETRPAACRNYEPGSSGLCPQFFKMHA
jgi:Fe-S-cluster containining protein